MSRKRGKREYERKQREIQYRWLRLAIVCFDELKTNRLNWSPQIVDREFIGNLDGKPVDMFIWLICEARCDVETLRANAPEFLDLYRELLLARGFPREAADTLRTDATSLEDIEAGGGRFYYFR